MRHFIYQDEKSHKFWAVEQQGNELHISWGKVGTKGQSQIKSFSDAAAVAKAELKLIAEKVKKGYVEQAKDNSLQPSQTVTGSLKVADLSTIIQEQPSFVAETRAPDKKYRCCFTVAGERYCCRFSARSCTHHVKSSPLSRSSCSASRQIDPITSLSL